jgi:hypothetical protein
MGIRLCVLYPAGDDMNDSFMSPDEVNDPFMTSGEPSTPKPWG